jgi:NADPH2:quinone reductase
LRAIRLQAPGGPEVLHLEDVPVPTPGPGQALIRVEAAGLNYIDVYHRIGLYKQPFPLTLGREAGGTVESVGPGVTTVRQGDRVASEAVIGAYAEYALVAADRLVPLPDGVSAKAGAAVMLQGLTAHYLVHSTCPLKRGDVCVVHAAAGGVGLLLCQMANRIGARVIGTVSTEEKADLARQAGAAEVILYSREEVAPAVRRLTGGTGVRVVYDSVGKTTFAGSLDCLAPRGMLVLYGQSSGVVEAFDPQILSQRGSLYLTRPTIAHYTATRAELLERAGEVLGDLADGTLSVRIGAEFPLERSADAHRALEGRRTTGKVLILP